MSKPNNFWKGKKVLITGHEGFLGSWLTRALLACGACVVGVDIVRHRPFSVLEDLRDKFIREEFVNCYDNFINNQERLKQFPILYAFFKKYIF